MTAYRAIEISPETETAAPRITDDMPMLRAAVDLTRDIAEARPAIYWSDLLASAALGYGALAVAILLRDPWATAGAGLISALALYRALLFIHELSHLHRDALPGFRTAWNLLVGIPLLTPSFMYEGVHTLHHARTRYGTADDPEYLPLGHMKPASLPTFALLAILLPPGLLLRSALLVPLGAIFPALRKQVWERASALAINPAFRRRAPEGAFVRMVFWQEFGATAWAIAVIAASWAYGWRPLLIAIAVVSVTALLNQVRTLVAHLWINEGEAMTVTAQFLDSVDVPPPGPIAELWAPVGLRYHATHHLLPSMPYHSLAEAHRRISAHFDLDATYHKSSHAGLWPLMARLVRSTMGAVRKT